jgi:hypothetical protein
VSCVAPTQESARSLHPGLEVLTDMGFHWRVAVHVLAAAGGNVEQAVDNVFTLGDVDGIVREWEVRACLSYVPLPAGLGSLSSSALQRVATCPDGCVVVQDRVRVFNEVRSKYAADLKQHQELKAQAEAATAAAAAAATAPMAAVSTGGTSAGAGGPTDLLTRGQVRVKSFAFVCHEGGGMTCSPDRPTLCPPPLYAPMAPPHPIASPLCPPPH